MVKNRRQSNESANVANEDNLSTSTPEDAGAPVGTQTEAAKPVASPTTESVATAESAAAAYNESEVERSRRVAAAQDKAAGSNGDKPKESKSSRFMRLARKRMTKCLLVLSHIENLTNPNTYEWTPAQAQRIVDSLVNAVNRITAKFNGDKQKREEFDF